jgi:uncharacterized protein
LTDSPNEVPQTEAQAPPAPSANADVRRRYGDRSRHRCLAHMVELRCEDGGVNVVALRRYPVKSMGGESLDRVDLDERGLVGDRIFAVTDDAGRLASGKNSRRFRRRDAVFDWSAATHDGSVVVQGPAGSWIVGDSDLDAALSHAMGDPVRVLREADVPHQDGGQVSLVGTASLEWCRSKLSVDADPRRLRINVVVKTGEPFEEEAWVGSAVSVGAVTLRIVERIERCRTVDLAQDGVTSTTPMLRALGAVREMCLGVYSDVVTPGTLAVADEVTVQIRDRDDRRKSKRGRAI